MGQLDPRLKFLARQSVSQLASLERLDRFAVATMATAADGAMDAAAEQPRVRVLLDFRGGIDAVRAAGFEPTTVAGHVAAGFAGVEDLERIAAVPGVRVVESSRPLTRELDLSRVETATDVVQAPPLGLTGAGVVVGVVDSGVDFLHGAFRNPDGSTRILAIWDQSLTPLPHERSPDGFGYGVEYGRAEIDAALQAANPFAVVRHRDPSSVGHGTHVAGIAAGNGLAAGNGAPAGTFVGMAPGADLVVVANYQATNLGDSANALDAVQYVFSVAERAGMPAVVNLSQGDNLGPHDGTSLLERGIDNLLSRPGRAMVKSAGNSGAEGIHASGRVPRGGTAVVPMLVPPEDTTPDTIDLWYPAADRLLAYLVTPDGSVAGPVSPGDSTTLELPNGNVAFADSSVRNSFNHDNRIYFQLQAGALPAIQPGVWAIVLYGRRVLAGTFHAWIERDRVRPSFVGEAEDRAFTLTIPGTSRRILTVGSYVTRAQGAGDRPGVLADSSSQGPTRDGRVKPDLVAPGQWIVSALAGANGDNQYRLLAGTSMAAPHVTGLVALLLERDPTLTPERIREVLLRSARREPALGAFPSPLYGHGKMNSQAAVALLDGGA